MSLRRFRASPPGGTHRRSSTIDRSHRRSSRPAFPSVETWPRGAAECEGLAIPSGHDVPALAGHIRVEDTLERGPPRRPLR